MTSGAREGRLCFSWEQSHSCFSLLGYVFLGVCMAGAGAVTGKGIDLVEMAIL